MLKLYARIQTFSSICWVLLYRNYSRYRRKASVMVRRAKIKPRSSNIVVLLEGKSDSISTLYFLVTFEPVHDNLAYDQVRHKQGCAAMKDG